MLTAAANFNPTARRLRLGAASGAFNLARMLLSTRTGKRNHYAILGINNDALPAEVRAAYMMAAKRYHPDVCKDSGAEHRFRDALQAYTILIDPQRRKMYDSGIDEEGIAAQSSQSQSSRGGARQAYEMWKQDILRYVCREFGLGDPYVYANRVQWQARGAFDAAWRTPSDLTPAREFGREHKGLLFGLTVSTVLTGGVPLVLLFTARVLQVLDANADEMMKPGWAPRWLRRQVWQPCSEMLHRVRRRIQATGSWSGRNSFYRR